MKRRFSAGLFAGLTFLLFLTFADARFDSAIRQTEASGSPMALPNAINSFYFPAVIDPVVDQDPAAAKPFAAGNIAGGILDMRVALPEFASPVDLYLALFFPSIYPEVLLIGPELQIVPISAGFTKWRENTVGPIDQPLFGPIPISGAPTGTYSLAVMATPAGDFSAYYLWVTSFDVSPPATGHSISGRVLLAGSGMPDVTITLTGSGSSSTVTDSNGYYLFTEAQNGSYTITPSKSGYEFSPASRPVSVDNADVTGQDFTATAKAPGY